MVASGLYLQLSFSPLPPLMLLCLDEILVRQTGSPRRWALVLGGLAVAELFVSDEVLANFSELTAIGIIVLAVSHRTEIRVKLRHAATGLGLAIAVTAVVVAYPVIYALDGPTGGRIHMPLGAIRAFSSDLPRPVVPASYQLVTTVGLAHAGDRLSGIAVTNAGYVAIPMLLAVIAIVYWLRRSALVRFFAIMTLAAFVLALGPRLKVDGYVTPIHLPERLIAAVPALEPTLPYRYGLFYLARDRDPVHDRPGSVDRPHRPPIADRWIRAALPTALVVVPLIPSFPFAMERLSTPGVFSSAAIPTGSVVLTYPTPTQNTSQPMAWQAATGLRFRLLGAYLYVPTGHGKLVITPVGINQIVLADIWAGRPPGPLTVAARTIPLAQLRSSGVSRIVVVTSFPHSIEAIRYFTDLLGRAPRSVRGAALWRLSGPAA